MFRQGDVLLVPVDEMPATAAPAPDGVVAHGEVSGHAHRLVAAQQWIDGAQRYVRVTGDRGELVHEEHAVIALPGPAVYRVVIQREYAPDPEIKPWVDPESPPVRPVVD